MWLSPFSGNFPNKQYLCLRDYLRVCSAQMAQIQWESERDHASSVETASNTHHVRGLEWKLRRSNANVYLLFQYHSIRSICTHMSPKQRAGDFRVGCGDTWIGYVEISQYTTYHISARLNFRYKRPLPQGLASFLPGMTMKLKKKQQFITLICKQSKTSRSIDINAMQFSFSLVTLLRGISFMCFVSVSDRLPGTLAAKSVK